MGLSAFLLILAAAGGFVLGRETSPSSSRETRARHVYTGRQGDVLRVPAAATRCAVSAEGGFPDLFCSRMPRGRYQVVFYEDSFLVFQNGKPDDPVFSARWRP
jgi:hypothetical protein